MDRAIIRDTLGSRDSPARIRLTVDSPTKNVNVLWELSMCCCSWNVDETWLERIHAVQIYVDD